MKELKLIRAFYGDKKAERSGVPLINHIEEGLVILSMIQATELSARAFCLHPMFQADADLLANENKILTECLDPWVMTLVMEYRNQANAWLSDKVFQTDSGLRTQGLPRSGPMHDVRMMLIADKVQNRKDFVTYHQATHPRSKALTIYFDTWLEALGVPQEDYRTLCEAIDWWRADGAKLEIAA